MPHIYSWNPLLPCRYCNEYTHGTVLRVVHQQLPRRSYHLRKHKLLNNTPVYTIQPVAKPVVQLVEQPVGRTVQDLFNIHPQNLPNWGVNRHFQAKLPQFQNCNISETIHPISQKFDDETHTINDTSWVVHHYRAGNRTWLTSAILKIDIKL